MNKFDIKLLKIILNEVSRYIKRPPVTSVRDSGMDTADLERVNVSQEEARTLVDGKFESKSKICKILNKIGILGRVPLSINL